MRGLPLGDVMVTKRRTTTSALATFARIRARCLSFAEATERDSHGSPTFFLREKRSFLTLVASYYGPGGRPAIVCAAPDGMQAALVDARPALYFLPKYVAKLGWIGMWLDAGARWPEISAVVDAAHDAVAEKLPPARPKTTRRPAKKSRRTASARARR